MSKFVTSFLIKFFLFFTNTSSYLENRLWKWCYQKMASTYQKNDWLFMNYGYVSCQPVELKSEDEENRLFIQLYHHVLSGIPIKGKDVLEVGSGRGGGSDYIARYLSPKTITGVDFSKNAIELSRQFYQLPNLKFKEGNAEKLPFDNDTFDVVLNVESSHCYGNMTAFLEEVVRVLKPGGIFAWADLRTQESMQELDKLFSRVSLKHINKENITPQVIKALDLISERKHKSINERVPPFWQPLFCEFFAIRDSKIYQKFVNGEMVYNCYRFQKVLNTAFESR